MWHADADILKHKQTQDTEDKSRGKIEQNIRAFSIILSFADDWWYLKLQHSLKTKPKPTFIVSQGWTGKTQPGLTHPVKTGLNNIEKPTKVGKIGYY